MFPLTSTSSLVPLMLSSDVCAGTVWETERVSRSVKGLILVCITKDTDVRTVHVTKSRTEIQTDSIFLGDLVEMPLVKWTYDGMLLQGLNAIINFICNCNDKRDRNVLCGAIG